MDLGRVRRNVPVAQDGRPPNIVILMLDTTRIDCLGCYGSTNGVTPRIDELATESVVFEQAVTPEPLTRPAVSTMLTGLYPRTHGVDTNRKKLADQFTTLPEVLSDNGYVTGGFMSAAVLSSFYGTGQGFDTYVGPAEGTWELSRMTAVAKLYYSAVNRSARLFEMPGGKTVERAATWIDNNRQRPFFAFVHLFDPHFPYDPPPEHDFAAREGFTGIRAPYSDPLVRFEPGFEMPDDYLEMMWLKYRGEVSYTDECVGRMLDALDSMGLADDTIVVLVSDHGESFEKGFYFAHGTRLFDSLVRVALMVRYPGLEEPHRVSGQVLLTDLYPSLLAMLDLPVEDDIQGRDVFTTRGGANADSVRPVFLQTDFENAEPNRARMSLGVRTPEWKYVVSPELDLTELYDLVNDPTEVVNLVDTRPEMRGRFAGLLSDWTAETEQNVRPVEELSPERLEALRALGYVQ